MPARLMAGNGLSAMCAERILMVMTALVGTAAVQEPGLGVIGRSLFAYFATSVLSLGDDRFRTHYRHFKAIPSHPILLLLL